MMLIRVLFVDTNNIAYEDIISSSFLSNAEIESLNRFKIIETRKEKAYSLIFKNRYIKEYVINEFGKPISDKVYFNVSHSKGAVVFIMDSLPVGIDIEQVRPMKEDMLNYISSNEEKAYIKNDINFFEIWTNKESITKTIGTGIKEKIKEIPGLPINGVKEYKNKKYYVRTLLYKGYVISITRESLEPFDIIIEEGAPVRCS